MWTYCSQRRACVPLSGLLAAYLLLTASSAYGGPYRVLENHYQGPYGFFMHWSAVARATQGARPSLAYSICDVDAKPLLFYWDGPGFGSGVSHPLQPGTCATLTKASRNFKEYDDTKIYFTQHDESWKASAYLPDEKTDLPEDWFTQLFGYFSREGSDPSIVNITIRVTVHKDKNVTYTLTWPQGIVGLAVGFDLKNLSDEARNQILADLGKVGVKARYASGTEIVISSDAEHLPGRAREASYLLMNPSFASPTGVRFRFPAKVANPVSAPMIVIDEGRRAVAIASYTTIR